METIVKRDFRLIDLKTPTVSFTWLNNSENSETDELENIEK